MSEKTPKVLALVGAGESSNIVLRALDEAIDLVAVIEEQRVSKARLIRGRLRRLGALKVVDQLVFQGAISPVLRRVSQSRAAEIRSRAGMDVRPMEDARVQRVANINDIDMASVVAEYAPDVVVINGTRILSAELLDAIECPILNTHAGVTPAYRGVHGGYWALREGRPDLCGVTVHLVDPGIDTGGVIAQAQITPTARDNFATYPLLQLEAGLPLLLEAVRDAADGALHQTEPLSADSALYYHPGVSTWLRGLLDGIK